MSDSEALSRLYRQLPTEEPNAALDASVLAAVNAEMVAAREQRARWQRRWRYQIPLATAATLVLAVALLLRQPGSQQELLERPQSDDQSATGYDMESAADKDAAMAAEPSTTASLMSPPPPPAMSPPPPVTYVPYVPLPAVVAPIAVPTPMETAAPAPEPVPMSASVEADSAMPASKQMPAMARIAPLGIIADQALPPAALAKLLAEATGMSAQEFCTRLQALWPEGEVAPACPTTDGQHQWPAPLAIVWQVNAGQVVRAEQPR